MVNLKMGSNMDQLKNTFSAGPLVISASFEAANMDR